MSINEFKSGGVTITPSSTVGSDYPNSISHRRIWQYNVWMQSQIKSTLLVIFVFLAQAFIVSLEVFLCSAADECTGADEHSQTLSRAYRTTSLFSRLCSPLFSALFSALSSLLCSLLWSLLSSLLNTSSVLWLIDILFPYMYLIVYSCY